MKALHSFQESES